jgi:hypothetical protein
MFGGLSQENWPGKNDINGNDDDHHYHPQYHHYHADIGDKDSNCDDDADDDDNDDDNDEAVLTINVI